MREQACEEERGENPAAKARTRQARTHRVEDVRQSREDCEQPRLGVLQGLDKPGTRVPHSSRSERHRHTAIGARAQPRDTDNDACDEYGKSTHANKTEAQTQGGTTQVSQSDCAHSVENEEMHALLALKVLVLHARLVHPDAPHRPHALLGRQEARGRGRVREEEPKQDGRRERDEPRHDHQPACAA